MMDVCITYNRRLPCHGCNQKFPNEGRPQVFHVRISPKLLEVPVLDSNSVERMASFTEMLVSTPSSGQSYRNSHGLPLTGRAHG